LIPKAGQPGRSRPLGIPAIYDRVCQQALLNRLEPIFEPVFDDASFGYRKGAKGDRPRMPCERSGRSWAREPSGSSMPTSKISLGQLIMRSS
jgi:Reverse transcriptase (RNA-dependent DNA polymerase)